MTKRVVTPGPPARAEPILARGATVGGVIAGKYRIERVIGHGGMGVVVAAWHLQLERTVAIKLIRGDWADDPLAVERLVREAKALASIQSEHVARVLDVGTLADGIPFIVMEYLEGRDLATLLERDGPLPTSDAVDFILQACEALAEAHRNGIVHRDIKPANLFVARQPGGGASIKVVDFGISKLINSASVESLTQPSRIVGSLYHMAPEQMRGEAVDARTDVWAIGVLLFELVTGRKPFPGAAWPAVCARVLNESAPLGVLGDDVPEELAAAVRRCLNRTPEDRFANVAELAVALSPFGSRNARVSLERIVRLATSTGSLSAESFSPLPPATRALAPAARAGHDTTIDPKGDQHQDDGPSSQGSGTSALRAAELGPLESAAAGSGLLAAHPLRSRRERWGAALVVAALLIGLPWLCVRNSARAPAAPSAEVASVALRPSEPAPPVAAAPESAPAAAEPSVAVVAEPSGGQPEIAAAPVGALPKAEEVALARAASALPAGEASPAAVEAVHAVAPSVGAALSSQVLPSSQVSPSSQALPSLGAAPSSHSLLPVAAAPGGAAASSGAASSGAAPPPTLPAPSGAAKAGVEPAASEQPRGSNPWDLRDLEFE